MKVSGNKNWPCKVLIEACGVIQMYTFPNEESMRENIRIYKELFPFIKIKIFNYNLN